MRPLTGLFALALLASSQAAEEGISTPSASPDLLAQAAPHLPQLCFLVVAGITAYHFMNKKY